MATIRWRDWPFGDHVHWSWIAPLGLVGVGAFVWWLGGGWLLGIVAAAALALAIWQFLIPVEYEVCSLGIRRYALGRMRLVPWSAIRAYRLRPTGVMFFQQADPNVADLLNSLFVPYPHDEDEIIVALRLHLPHAAELP